MMTELDCGAECANWAWEKRVSLCGGRGRMVGRFFVFVDGRVVLQPRGTQLPGHYIFREPDVPVWEVPRPIYNMQDLWHCEACETNYPTTLGPYRGCVGLGSSAPIVQPGGGECYA